MKRIHFKSGKTLDIQHEIAEIIAAQIEKGARQWQNFRDASNNNRLLASINLNEVEFIAEAES